MFCAGTKPAPGEVTITITTHCAARETALVCMLRVYVYFMKRTTFVVVSVFMVLCLCVCMFACLQIGEYCKNAFREPIKEISRVRIMLCFCCGDNVNNASEDE